MRFPEQVRRALKRANEAGRPDFHISEIKLICRIPKGRFEDSRAHAIVREVKKIAPFDIWTVHERSGWYTRNATYEVRLVAFYMAAKASATRLQLQTDILTRHRRGDKMTGLALGASRMMVGAKELFEVDLPASDREDSTLTRIDRLIASERDQ